jgi:hypothetical protein
VKDAMDRTCSTNRGTENFISISVGGDHLRSTGLNGRITMT